VTIQVIPIGSAVEAGDGIPFRTAFALINANFADLDGRLLSSTSGLTTEIARATAAEATLRNTLAPLLSPAFTGVPTAPTPAVGTTTTQIATAAMVTAAVAAGGGGGGGGVPTTRQILTSGLATGGGDLSADRTIAVPAASATDVATGTDATKALTAASVSPALAAKAPLASPAFTGTPTVPTATAGTNTTQAASTAFVTTAVAGASGGGVSSSSLDTAFGSTRGGILERGAGGWTNLAPGASGYVLTSNGVGADPSYQAPAAATVPPAGQCRLGLTNSTTLTLRPYSGNQITVGGTLRTIPSAGVTLASTGLAAATLYYVYAYWTGSALALEASTTTHATDTSTGLEIKSGDATRTLVGMAYVATSATFTDTASQRLVANWFNRVDRGLGSAVASVSTSSASSMELSTSYRVAFVSFSDARVNLVATGSHSNSAAWVNYFQIALDGTALGSSYTQTITSSGNPFPIGFTATPTPSEGYHFGTLNAFTSGGSLSATAVVSGSVYQ
jgi:hypothetical protein